MPKLNPTINLGISSDVITAIPRFNPEFIKLGIRVTLFVLWLY